MTTATAAALATPFRGLAPFGEGELDALLFFGRERETEIAVANLLASRLTVLYGPSGVGKTSLLRAGVARRIRELAERRAIGRGPDGAVVVFSEWSGDPVAALSDAIATEVTSLVRQGVAPPAAGASLTDVVEHWSTVLDGELFLVLDQLEELFVYHGGEEGSGSIVDELPEVIQRPRLRTHVLLSLRDDALAQLDVLKDRVPGLYANVLRLDRLDRQAATAAILGPIGRYDDLVPVEQRVDIEPELVDAVLAQAALPGEELRVEPPYLQLVMERLWAEEHERGSRILRSSTLAELGGAQAIVREHLDRALDVLSPPQQDAVAAMFAHLVTPSGTKIAHRSDDLAEMAHVPPGDAGEVLSLLGRERILRSLDEGEGGGTRYEIFHDVLSGAILSWRHRHELEHERRAAKRHKRRLIEVVLGAAAALLVMLAITLYALDQRSTARSRSRASDARALAASALVQLDRDPAQSLVLARHAAALSSSPLVEDVLRTAILDSRVRRIVPLGGPGLDGVFRGRQAVATTANGRVVVADARTGHVLRVEHVDRRRLLLDPAGGTVLGLGIGKRPELLDVGTGRRLVLATRPVVEAAFAERGTAVATRDAGPFVKVWSLPSGRLVRTVRAAGGILALSRTGSLLAVASGARIAVFDVRTGRQVALLVQRSPITQLAFSPGARVLAAAGEDRAVRVQTLSTGNLLAVDKGQHGAVTALAFSPRGTMLAAACTDGAARLWTVRGVPVSTLLGHKLGVTGVRFSSDGFRVVTTSDDGTARVWQADSGDPIAVLAGHGEPVASAVFSRTGGAVVTTGADGTMRFWDAVAEPTLTVRARYRAVQEAARDTAAGLRSTAGPDLSVSADGRRAAVASGRKATVRDVVTGKVLAVVTTPEAVRGVALAPNGRSVAASGRGVVRVYALGGRLLRTLRAPDRAALTRIAFDPQGTHLAAGSTDRDALVWALAGGAPVVLHGHTDTVLSARFDPTGREVLTAGRDHLAVVWDARTGRRLRVLRAHFGQVADAAFSPDGRWIVTAGPSKAGLWDARSGALLFYLQGHEGPLTSASFARDGRTVVTSGEDGTVRSYRCDVCTGVDGLRRIADAQLAAARG